MKLRILKNLLQIVYIFVLFANTYISFCLFMVVLDSLVSRFWRLSWFEILTRFLLVILPFHVFLSVFIQFRLGIPGISIYKEIVILGLIVSLGYEFWRTKTRPKWDILDMLIGAYIVYMVGITLVTAASMGQALRAIVAGGRYDFEFFLILLIYRHGHGFLKESLGYYTRLFLASATLMLALSILERFVFKETILLNFGFSASLSNWDFGGSIPIYHGIPGANIRRFQGIMDGPNAAAFFILVYLGILIHYFRTKRDYFFLVAVWSSILIGLIYLTYCRSALVGGIVAIGCMLLIHARIIWRYIKQILIGIIMVAVMSYGFVYLY